MLWPIRLFPNYNITTSIYADWSECIRYIVGLSTADAQTAATQILNSCVRSTAGTHGMRGMAKASDDNYTRLAEDVVATLQVFKTPMSIL